MTSGAVTQLEFWRVEYPLNSAVVKLLASMSRFLRASAARLALRARLLAPMWLAHLDATELRLAA